MPEPRAKPTPPPATVVAVADRDDGRAVEAFAQSMPEPYRRQYSYAEIREHAAIVARRGDELAHLELWKIRPHGIVIAIVTNDRPGLLSMLSAAIAAHSFDVLGANVYCRKRADGVVEAVDLFWVRRRGTPRGRADLDPVTSNEIQRLKESVTQLLRGEVELDDLLHRARPTVRMRAPLTPRVAFAGEVDGAAILRVDVGDRPGILLAVASALFRSGARIVHSEIATVNGRASDQFHVREVDETAPTRSRQREIVNAVVAAIEAVEG